MCRCSLTVSVPFYVTFLPLVFWVGTHVQERLISCQGHGPFFSHSPSVVHPLVFDASDLPSHVTQSVT